MKFHISIFLFGLKKGGEGENSKLKLATLPHFKFRPAYLTRQIESNFRLYLYASCWNAQDRLYALSNVSLY